MSKRVGILGGGQLGLLLAQSLVRLGSEVAVYDPDLDAPACKQTSFAWHGSWTDTEKLQQFFADCDVITYEFENVQTDLLFSLQKEKPMMPSASVLSTTQNRGREKSFMRDNALPHPRFQVVEAGDDLVQAVSVFGLPCIAKTTFGGYDGKGQFLLQSAESVKELSEKTKADPVELILEEKIVLDMEVSCIVGRASSGAEVAFPVFENQHRDHILDVTILPARVPATVQDKVREIAIRATRELNVVGLLTIEFFLTKTAPQSGSAVAVDDWYILINEFAPRPHNSGHITMKACDVSQFDILARVLLGMPLREPKMVSADAFCMGNLLGDVWLAQQAGENNQSPKNELDLTIMAKFPEVVDVVVYGKKEPRAKRKMGHFIACTADVSKLPEIADRFRAHLGATKVLR